MTQRRVLAMAPSYIARVEWRGTPPRETYDKLHALMSNLGFKQTIKGIHDETHIPVEADLPHATYAGVSDLEATRVTSYLAEQIRNAIQPDIVLLVVGFDKWETYPDPRPSTLATVISNPDR
jgi:hypothetical protein